MRKPYKSGDGKHDKKVAGFIDRYWKKHCRPPSMREIAAGCKITSICVVSNTLRRLGRDGEIVFVDDISRGVVPRWVQERIQEKVFQNETCG